MIARNSENVSIPFDQRGSSKSLREYVDIHWETHYQITRTLGHTGVSSLLRKFLIDTSDPWSSTYEYRSWVKKQYSRGFQRGRFAYSDIDPSSNPLLAMWIYGLYDPTVDWMSDIDKSAVLQTNDDGLDALALAVRHEHRRLYEDLIRLGSDVNRILLGSTTALHQAIMKRNIRDIEFLISKGADPNIDTDRMPICLAASYHFAKAPLVDALLNAGADPNKPCRKCRFHFASVAVTKGDKYDAMESLIEAGADVNHQTVEGFGSLLAAAVTHGALECAKMLVENGAMPNVQLQCPKYSNVLAAALFVGKRRFIDVTPNTAMEMVRFLVEEAGLDVKKVLCYPPSGQEDTGSPAETVAAADYLIKRGHASLEELQGIGYDEKSLKARSDSEGGCKAS